MPSVRPPPLLDPMRVDSWIRLVPIPHGCTAPKAGNPPPAAAAAAMFSVAQIRFALHTHRPRPGHARTWSLWFLNGVWFEFHGFRPTAHHHKDDPYLRAYDIASAIIVGYSIDPHETDDAALFRRMSEPC